MANVLDLTIALNLPPVNMPKDTIASIDLRCDSLGLSHTGDLLQNPISPDERADLHWYLETYWQWPYEGFAIRGQAIETALPQIGRRLFESVFGSLPARDLLQAWRLQVAQPGWQGQISILSDLPAALSVPWELLHDQQGFLVLRTRPPVAILRRLRISQLGALLTPFEPPLRILMATARPEDTAFINPRSIAHELLDAVQAHIDVGKVVVEFLRPHVLTNNLTLTKVSPHE